MRSAWDVIGAPSSAGAHTPGVEQAPTAVRAAGLVALLGKAGDVVDRGDVPGVRWAPDRARPTAQNADQVARVAVDVAREVERSLRSGRQPLVIGGDCTVTLGLVIGCRAAGAPAGIVYIDGGPDLYTPATRPNGNLDAMGLAHLLALPGTVPEIAALGGNAPMLHPNEVVAFGDSLPPGDHEYDLVAALGITHVGAAEVHHDPTAAALRARATAETASAAFVVHFDVDVLDFREMPLADVPEPAGITLEAAVTALNVLVSSPAFAGLALTEINPDHLPDDQALPRFVRRLADALTTPMARPAPPPPIRRVPPSRPF